MLLEKNALINKSVFFIDKIGTIRKAIVESVSSVTEPEQYFRLRCTNELQGEGKVKKSIPILLGVPESNIFLSEEEAYDEMSRRIMVS